MLGKNVKGEKWQSSRKIWASVCVFVLCETDMELYQQSLQLLATGKRNHSKWYCFTYWLACFCLLWDWLWVRNRWIVLEDDWQLDLGIRFTSSSPSIKYKIQSWLKVLAPLKIISRKVRIPHTKVLQLHTFCHTLIFFVCIGTNKKTEERKPTRHTVFFGP